MKTLLGPHISLIDTVRLFLQLSSRQRPETAPLFIRILVKWNPLLALTIVDGEAIVKLHCNSWPLLSVQICSSPTQFSTSLIYPDCYRINYAYQMNQCIPTLAMTDSIVYSDPTVCACRDITWRATSKWNLAYGAAQLLSVLVPEPL